MPVRIGNQTASSASRITEPFEYAVAQGFDAFEWFPDKKASGQGWDEDDLDLTTRNSIKMLGSHHDINLTIHAPLHWTPLGGAARHFFNKTMALAKDIGARLLNIHLTADEGVAPFIQAILPFAQEVAQAGITLSVENTPLTPPEDFNKLFAQVVRLQPAVSKHLGMCLDLGHANLCESTRNDYLGYIDWLEPHVPIVHVHMHENFGDHDAHLPLFTGPASGDKSGIKGFVKRMKARGFSGNIILEQWPDPPSLLNEARNRLIQIWGN